jgi:UDP-N-acetylglucosamine 1-carboxyvinyltransferase
VRASGNKNGALPILAACALASDEVRLSNVPRIRDVETMVELLADLGADVEWTGSNEVSRGSGRHGKTEPRRRARTRDSRFVPARRSIARTLGRVTVPPPGGDVIGRRRLDTHVHAFSALGADVHIDGVYELSADGLRGTRMYLDEASVMGTENAIMAAVLAEGETVLGHAACEPHIQDLCRFLISIGAEIEGIGSNVLHIHGRSELAAATTGSARITSRSRASSVSRLRLAARLW